MKTVYIGIGSNLGNRAANLLQARERLHADGIKTIRASSIYETAPRDMENQPWFLNQVIEAETDLEPGPLLERLIATESAMGRQRTVPKGPRLIDLDILLYADNVIELPNLRVPHPHMHQRRFVMEPLAELAPDLSDPRSGRTMSQLLELVKDQVLRKK